MNDLKILYSKDYYRDKKHIYLARYEKKKYDDANRRETFKQFDTEQQYYVNYYKNFFCKLPSEFGGNLHR
jgi:hypothetical protein